MTPGPLLATGRTSEVFLVGTDSVLKVLRPEVPAEWAAFEAQFTVAVRGRGVRAPEMRGLHEVDGRPAIEFERIDGPSLWQVLLDAPEDVDDQAAVLADVHQRILRAGLPTDLPDVVRRLRTKITDASLLSPEERTEARTLAAGLARGAALLHGDLHPGNVLMSDDGPVVIDWFDAAIGNPVADVVRSSILMRPAIDGAELPHLPGATPGLLSRMHRAYLASFTEVLSHAGDTLRSWEAAVAAGRLAEGAESKESTLLELFRTRNDRARVSVLTQIVSAVG